MRNFIYHLAIASATFSCRTPKPAPVQVQLPNLPVHIVAYEMEVTPADKFQDMITFLNQEGKMDSITTAKPWRYEFYAPKGTVLRAKAIAKPNNPQERVRGMVRLNIIIDGAIVDASVGSRIDVDHEVK
jgi:hypothetical protein